MNSNILKWENLPWPNRPIIIYSRIVIRNPPLVLGIVEPVHGIHQMADSVPTTLYPWATPGGIRTFHGRKEPTNRVLSFRKLGNTHEGRIDMTWNIPLSGAQRSVCSKW